MNIRAMLAFVAAVGSTSSALAESTAVQARVTRVEKGLLLPITVRGEEAHPMKLEERMRSLHVPGLSIAVINNGAIEWTRAYGEADERTHERVTDKTVFQVASISKPVTAALAMRLAAAGKLRLDQAADSQLHSWHFPPGEFNPKGATVGALLSHTAGIEEYDLPGYGSADAVPTLMQVLDGEPPATNPSVRITATPGSRYAYTGLGYAVVQQTLIDAGGKSFDALAQEYVLQPLGMRDSFFAQSPASSLAGRIAAGHDLGGATLDGGWRRYPELAPAGLWGTASDLARFVLAMQQAATGKDARFLDQKQALTMLTPVRESYGLGFELDGGGPERVFHHSGSNAGYKALMFAYTRTGKGAVVLTNGDNGWPLIEEVMRSIAREYGWPDYRPVERAAMKVNPALLDRFTGDFQVSNVVLHVSRNGEHLYLAGPPLGEQPVELIPSGAYDFFMREKDATVHFDANGGAAVETLTFIDGRPRPGKRIRTAED